MILYILQLNGCITGCNATAKTSDSCQQLCVSLLDHSLLYIIHSYMVTNVHKYRGLQYNKNGCSTGGLAINRVWADRLNYPNVYYETL